MIQISIDGISVDINKINYIHIVEVSDEERKIFKKKFVIL